MVHTEATALGRFATCRVRNRPAGCKPAPHQTGDAASLTLKDTHWSSAGGVGLNSNKPFFEPVLKTALMRPDARTPWQSNLEVQPTFWTSSRAAPAPIGRRPPVKSFRSPR